MMGIFTMETCKLVHSHDLICNLILSPSWIIYQEVVQLHD